MLDLVDDLYQQGLKLHGSGKVELAYQVYTLVLNAHPEHSMANHSLGVLSVDIGKVQEALPFFEAALEANADVAQFWVSYIDALINLERIADAQAVFGQAKSNGAKGEGFDKLERRLTDARGEPLTANSTGLEEKQPKHSNILDGLKLDQALSLARKKARGGDTEEAKRIYQDILAKFPKNKRARDGLKGLSSGPVGKKSKVQDPPHKQLQALINLYSQGQLQQALHEAGTLVQKFPQSATLFNIQAAAFKDLGHLDHSIEAYNKALSIKPDNAEAYYNMANALQEQGKLEEAVEAYNKAIIIKHDDAEAHNNLGVALQEQGKKEEAMKAYTKALIIKPDYAEAYNNMGLTLEAQDKLEEAVEIYKKAIEIKPNLAEAVQNLVKLPYGVLNVDSVNIANNFLENYRDKIKNDSKLNFLEANYLMHSNRLDLAFDKFVQANNKKIISSSKLEAMNTNHSTFEKTLKKWQLKLAPKDSNKLTKIFILAPPRSGKSQLETLLSKSQVVKPLSDAIKFQKNFERITFEQLFGLDETCLCQQGFHAITTTNPHSIFKAMDIARQLPNAFFIFINRDKYDVASEIFRSDWITGHEFAYDPNNIFRLIELYKNASDTFIERLPNNSISISFEEILYQPNEALRQIEECISIQFGLKRLDFTKSKIPLRSVFQKHFHAKFSHLESFNGLIDQV